MLIAYLDVGNPLVIVAHVLETLHNNDQALFDTTMPIAVNGITATSDANTKAIKSKNQLRRAKAKQKKAAAASDQTTPVGRIRVSLAGVVTDAGYPAHRNPMAPPRMGTSP